MELESKHFPIQDMLAALVLEYGGEIQVSTEWFTTDRDEFKNKQLMLEEADGLIRITLVEMETE